MSQLERYRSRLQTAAMESSIVVKVKYGETLRRFNAEIDLSIDELREKILCLFKIPSDAEITLTYIDEDGDEVTLADDDDLKEIFKQELNPLRMSLKLNAKGSDRPSERSGGCPSMQPPCQNENAHVSEHFNTVPELLHETISKLSADMASKATLPVFYELAESFSKMGLSYLNQLQQTQNKKESRSQGRDPENASGADNNAGCSKKSPVNEVLKPSEASSKPNESSLTSMPEASAFNTKSFSVNLNEPLIGAATGDPDPVLFKSDIHSSFDSKKFGDSSLVGKALGISNARDSAGFGSTNPSGFSISDNPMWWGYSCNSNSGGPSRKISHDGSLFSGPPLPGLRFMDGFPFPGVQTADKPFSQLPVPFDAPLKGSRNRSVEAGKIFHKGVRCDGCGVYPITGTRFKSNVKDDYDLCSNCFVRMGIDEADYIRMDHPINIQHPSSFRGLSDRHARMRPPYMHREIGMRPSRPKLDSRFIQDVNIPDGTIITPSTAFTKIWRMRNNGNVIWPKGSQLVWIGGDILSDVVSVHLQITEAGLSVEQELDVAVDFVAPALPGRYVSYWRMASPLGQKFGQRVWVLFQVATSTPVSENLRGLNLNLPPASSSMLHEMIDVNREPIVDEMHTEPILSCKSVEFFEPVLEGTSSMMEQEVNFPTTDSLFVGLNSKPQSAPPATGSSISYPVVDGSNVAPAIVPAATLPHVDQSAQESSEVEFTLLKELEEMGFKEIDLNKEILRRNEYDLEQSVDDLCGVSEWDPILEDLEEMGFCDKDVNRKLLKKNGGSLKRVVMDLIAGENENK